MNKILVSTVITTYNWNKKWLAECLDSILNQTYKNIEIIIVNDDSNNDIEKTIIKYQQKYKNITYLINKENLWVSKSSNKWIKLSKWKYIARIDDDDLRDDKTKIEKQVKFMEENQDYWLCGVEYIKIIDEEWKLIWKTKNRLTDSDIRNHILQSNQFAHSSIIFRKDYAEKLWLYDEEYRAALDYEIICKIWSKYKFSNLEWLSISYRINTKWITKKRHWLQYKNARKIFLNNHNNFPNFYKALILRIWDFILPEKLTKYILKIIKELNLYFPKFH
jgi:glycosyltransferase involved in cell wall biosynthesis